MTESERISYYEGIYQLALLRIAELEHAMGAQARKEMLPMQPGDICRTAADTSLLERETGYKPRVRLGEGLAKFAEWYKNYHN